MAFVGGLKEFTKIKIRDRLDDLFDQYTRIFMVKIYTISVLILSFNYFKDKINCIHGNADYLNKDFIDGSCWILGYYIYKELLNPKYYPQSGYFGIPLNLKHNGLTADGTLCSVEIMGDACNKMTRVYYNQHQWLIFYFCILPLIYYVPYIFFTVINTGLSSIKKLSEKNTDELSTNQIYIEHFGAEIYNKKLSYIKISLYILNKLIYILVNIVVFLITNRFLYNNFLSYGIDMLNFNTSDEERFQLKTQTRVQPAYRLLPPHGMCELSEMSINYRETRENKHLLVCEFSPNILYTFVLFISWYIMVIGIIISIIGFVTYIVKLIIYSWILRKNNADNRMTFRGITLYGYLKLIQLRSTSRSLYLKIIGILQDNINRTNNSLINDNDKNITYI